MTWDTFWPAPLPQFLLSHVMSGNKAQNFVNRLNRFSTRSGSLQPLPQRQLLSGPHGNRENKRTLLIVHDLDEDLFKKFETWLKKEVFHDGQTDVNVWAFAIEASMKNDDTRLLSDRFKRNLHLIHKKKQTQQFAFIAYGIGVGVVFRTLLESHSLIHEVLEQTTGTVFISTASALQNSKGKSATERSESEKQNPKKRTGWKNEMAKIREKHNDATRGLSWIKDQQTLSGQRHEELFELQSATDMLELSEVGLRKLRGSTQSSQEARIVEKFDVCPERTNMSQGSFSLDGINQDVVQCIKQILTRTISPTDNLPATESLSSSERNRSAEREPILCDENSGSRNESETSGQPVSNRVDSPLSWEQDERPEIITMRYLEDWNLPKALEWSKRALLHHQQIERADDLGNIPVIFIKYAMAQTFLRMGHFADAARSFDELENDIKSTGKESKILLPAIARRRVLLCASQEDFRIMRPYLESFSITTLKEYGVLDPDKEDLLIHDALASVNTSLGFLQGAKNLAQSNIRRWIERKQSSGTAIQRDAEFEKRATLDSQQTFAQVLLECGEAQDAFDQITQVIKGMRKTWGPEHVVTLKAVSLQAKILFALGRFSQAELKCKFALDRIRRQLGETHNLTLDTMSTLVKVYCSQARWLDAEELATFLSRENHKGLGQRHPQAVDSDGDLAEILFLQGKYGAAEEIQHSVVFRSKITFGTDHPMTWLNMARLGELYCSTLRWEKAQECLQDLLHSLPERTTDHGSEDCTPCWEDFGIKEISSRRKMGSVARKLSRYYQTQRDMEQAISTMNSSKTLLFQSRARAKDCFPARHPELSSAEFNLALVYRDSAQINSLLPSRQEKLECAPPADTLSTLLNVLDRKASNPTIRDPEIFTLQHEISTTLCLMGRFEEAEEYAQQALDGRSGRLGPQHPDVLHSQYHVALVYQSLGRLDEAQKLLESILSLSRRNVNRQLHVDRIGSAGLSTFDTPGISTKRHAGHQIHNQELDQKNVRSISQGDRSAEEEMEASKGAIDDQVYIDELALKSTLATIYAERGYEQDAVTMQEEVIEAKVLQHGDYADQTLDGIYDLAGIFRLSKQPSKALGKYQTIVDRLEERPAGHKHPLLLASKSEMASILLAQGKLEEVEEIQTHLLQVHKKIFGPEHRDTLVCRYNLALTLRIQGKKSKAEEKLAKAVELSKRTFGEQDRDTQQMLQLLTDWKASKRSF